MKKHNILNYSERKYRGEKLEIQTSPNPVVSIIMPVYNVEAYINQAVNSILEQSFAEFELIAINDGSTDTSPNILRKYEEIDCRIKILNQTNQGLSSARNAGIKKARGSFIYFFDSDDLLHHDALKTCIEYIKEYNLDLITFSAQAFYDENQCEGNSQPYKKPRICKPIQGIDLFTELVTSNRYSSTACLYIFSKQLLSQSKLWFDEGFLHEDEAFTPILFFNSARAISIDTMLYLRRVRSGSIMTRPYSKQNIDGLIQAIGKLQDFYQMTNTLPLKNKKALRYRQRELLRVTMTSTSDISLYSYYQKKARQNLGMRTLVSIDYISLLYIYFNGLYCTLRKLKKAIYKGY